MLVDGEAAEIRNQYYEQRLTIGRIAVIHKLSYKQIYYTLFPASNVGRAGVKDEFYLRTCHQLNEKTVIEIRKLAAEGKKAREIAEMFYLTPYTVRSILKRRTWAHVPDEV
jgi:hypothetical protein